MVVLNAVEILTAKETQITNMVQRSRSIAMIHSYLTDTLKTAASNAQAEETDYTMSQRTTPSRVTNLVQFIVVPFNVTRTQQQVEHYYGENALQRETRKALIEWGNDYEFNFVRAAQVSAVSGTGSQMDGIIAGTSLAKNHTSHTSGTTWAATHLDGMMKLNWDNSNGEVATDVFMGSHLRRATDGFTQKNNVVVNNPGGQTRIVRTVTTYETAFGTVNIHKHRYIQQSTDLTGRVLAINPTKIASAWLQMPFIDTGLARGGDYDKRAVIGKTTMEARNQECNWFADGFIDGTSA